MSVAYYGKREADDPGQVANWHRPAFLVPSCAASIFFFFLPEMEAVEEGWDKDPLESEAYTQLRRLALQVFTQRPRNDHHTELYPLSPERFRETAQWLGANAITYRPIFQVAALFVSPEMMDTVVYVVAGAHEPASHNWVETDMAFWNEGMTSDGLGWGARAAELQGVLLVACDRGHYERSGGALNFRRVTQNRLAGTSRREFGMGD